MTRDEILAMQPGRELDSMVAEKVMGWEVRREYLPDQSFHEFYYRNGEKYENVNYPVEWLPSTNISAAWKVAEQFPCCEIFKRRVGRFDVTVVAQGMMGKVEDIENFPEAICKSALLAVLEV